MNVATSRQLVDKIYEKRKAAALDLEKQVRECHQQGEHKRIGQIVDQLIEMFSDVSNPLHIRNGGLIGLAGTAIALGVDIAPYMEKFIEPLLNCFLDSESRIRYFSAECLYNIAKVSKGEVLVYFNDVFDALSKLAADSELSVKNGAELLDRLLKDIVAESASVYVPLYPETARAREELEEKQSVLVLLPHSAEEGPKKAFSLPHFIPLLRERIHVVNPFTRSYLVNWITTLHSVPELELITYLPEFLDGLLKYLSDPTEDVRVATENALGDFIGELRKMYEHPDAPGRKPHPSTSPPADAASNTRADSIYESETRSANGDDYHSRDDVNPSTPTAEGNHINYEVNDHDLGEWVPGQGVRVDFPAILDILLQQLDGEHDEIQQSTALTWIAEFVTLVPEVIVPFTPRLIPAILPNLAHHVLMIQQAATKTNKILFNVIQKLPIEEPTPPPPAPTKSEKGAPTKFPRSPTPTISGPVRQSALSKEITRDLSTSDLTTTTTQTQQDGPPPPPQRTRSATGPDPSATPRPTQLGDSTNSGPDPTRSHSPAADSLLSQSGVAGNVQSIGPTPPSHDDNDPFDYQATVAELTIQFLSEFEETRVSALKWLIMLHQKVPTKILAMHDGTFPALLKTLSDSSEEVIKHDLQLLAQISSSSEETYFKAFMMNLLELFSTDRRLLETRGSLIIRQLCVNLNTEKIYRAFAEIIEKEEDLEFASVIVQKLNIILITSPELAEFRRRLKSLETRQDGQALFTTLYRCWCHNAVSVFSLCLLAQAYEHASNLLHIFADLEITVPMLVQVDKLVQLIESPVFTYLRLQLLEPERYPYLFKCLYGLLMLLPQSSAFVSLRNRLNAVNSAGFLHIAPKSTVAAMSSRSKLGRDEIKWQELLQHFRTVQAKHEKARRQATGVDTSLPGFHEFDKSSDSGSADRNVKIGGRIPMRRRVTGGDLGTPAPPLPIPNRGGALSPLNPAKGRILPGGPGHPVQANGVNAGVPLTQSQKARRPEIVRK
ncbi:hypothetical protein CC2G_010275 [Coprinopsis cinerea AmutBmut pab1-1]|nr:hypothetical protein CC2G_010275 [Coprinopsis cinerea AmutBmut pab1-1]